MEEILNMFIAINNNTQMPEIYKNSTDYRRNIYRLVASNIKDRFPTAFRNGKTTNRPYINELRLYESLYGLCEKLSINIFNQEIAVSQLVNDILEYNAILAEYPVSKFPTYNGGKVELERRQRCWEKARTIGLFIGMYHSHDYWINDLITYKAELMDE